MFLRIERGGAKLLLKRGWASRETLSLSSYSGESTDFRAELAPLHIRVAQANGRAERYKEGVAISSRLASLHPPRSVGQTRR
jgi:hypothetical protein